MGEQLEDRLSSLPDPILIDILSRLYINEAAATSALSRRWRHLWTGVTRLDVCWNTSSVESDNYCLTAAVDILQQLTSPKLSVFVILLKRLECPPNEVISLCFHELLRRNVEHVSITAENWVSYDDNNILFLSSDDTLFQTQSLVTLKLSCLVSLPEKANIQLLPNLKRLELNTLVNFPSWLGTLISSSPLLEILDLKFDLFNNDYEPHHYDLNVSAPNLKHLSIHIKPPLIWWPPGKIFIDAPKLVCLTIIDRIWRYYFVQNSPVLNSAYIDFGNARMFDEEHEWMSEFVTGIMSSVCELVLLLEPPLLHLGQNNIFTYLNSLNHWSLKVRFLNLVSLETVLTDVGLDSWKEFLICLHCFPNLRHLNLSMQSVLSVEHNNWSKPVSVPECLARTLEKIEISTNLQMNTDELSMLGYILSNAVALEKLCVTVANRGRSANAEVWNGSKFCRALFGLPRGSSTCEVVFSNQHMRATSNDFKETSLKCELFF